MTSREKETGRRDLIGWTLGLANVYKRLCQTIISRAPWCTFIGHTPGVYVHLRNQWVSMCKELYSELGGGGMVSRVL